MNASSHRAITRQALKDLFSARALEAILAANLGQDTLAGQIKHDEYHFDNNAFEASYAYLESRRAEICPAMEAGKREAAWRSFGQLTHSVQDFYAHTNYVTLWLEQAANNPERATTGIDALDAGLLASPALKSGRLYYPLEALAFVPVLKRLVMPLLPRDAHAWMNMDAPGRPGYEHAESAAVQRTRLEFSNVTQDWPVEMLAAFTDLQEV